jgi:hypothetical protein
VSAAAAPCEDTLLVQVEPGPRLLVKPRHHDTSHAVCIAAVVSDRCMLYVLMQYSPSADEPGLPDKIGHYHTLYPLEDLSAAESAGVSAAWGVRTTCLKGISSRDGHAYCLRVVCGKQVRRV